MFQFNTGKSPRSNAIFLNCHDNFGGAERRFARAFADYLIDFGNILLIANKSSIKSLNAAGILKSKKGIICMPGGVAKPGKTYAIYHIVNAILLIFYSLKNRIRHIHYPVDPSIYSFIHSLVLRPLGITYSLSIVDSSRNTMRDFSYIRRTIWRHSIKRARGIDFLSDGIKKNISTLFSKEVAFCSNIQVSPCSFTDYTKAHYSEEKEYDLVMMCRLHSKKGHDLLFSALQYIKTLGRSGDIKSIGIFGSGPLENQIRSEVEAFKDFNISLKKTKDPFGVFSKTKFLLSLQADENYPSQAILEALSSGAYIIATDVGETYKIVPSAVGFRTSSNAKDLGETILYALEHYTFNRSTYTLLNSFATKSHSAKRFSLYLWDFIIESAALCTK
ncbi:glycosyltransferase [Pseudomonas sp. GCEP-101]|uniref:glycosyltransferase n=1 Tax=Pseudomonas sp. GCEP-101 TaxID=2974552 RepID=UPI00223B82D3|nr:glycosyltransferase [Pseudomonas sp. GCEP-101]